MGYQFPIFFRPQDARKPDKIAEHNPLVQRWIEFLTAYNYTLEYRKGSANGNADFLSRLPLPATELDRGGPGSLTPSDEEHVFLIRSHGLLLGGPSAVRVGLDGLAPSDPSSGLGGLTLSPHDFQDFRKHGPRMRVDDLDAPSGEFVARAPLPVASRGPHWVFPVNACASDPVAASVFVAPAAPLPTSADGADLDHHVVSSALPSPLLDDNTPHPSSVAAPASSTVVLDKDGLGAIPPSLPVHIDSAAHQMDSGPQVPSAVPHSASRVAGNNRAQVPVVPAAPPLLPSPCLLYTSPSPRDKRQSRMPSSA